MAQTAVWQPQPPDLTLAGLTARWSDPHRLADPLAGSEKAAAHRLGLSHSTVKHHLANARSKLGVATTAQLVWILRPRLPEPGSTAQPEERLTLEGHKLVGPAPTDQPPT